MERINSACPSLSVPLHYTTTFYYCDQQGSTRCFLTHIWIRMDD